VAELEIHWPETVETTRLFDAIAELEEAGIETECLSQPVRRGIVVEALVLVAVPALEPFLKVVFEKVGTDAYNAVRRFVRGLFGQDDRRGQPSGTAPAAVVFESTATGAQFVFTPGLPDKAFRAALGIDPGQQPGRWVWDASAQRWLRFEAGTG
jgi:hypothetical protein